MITCVIIIDRILNGVNGQLLGCDKLHLSKFTFIYNIKIKTNLSVVGEKADDHGSVGGLAVAFDGGQVGLVAVVVQRQHRWFVHLNKGNSLHTYLRGNEKKNLLRNFSNIFCREKCKGNNLAIDQAVAISSSCNFKTVRNFSSQMNNNKNSIT